MICFIFLKGATVESNLSVLKVLKFWWPLAIVRGVQTISRPIINLFVARDLNGSDKAIQILKGIMVFFSVSKALAVLTIVYPVAFASFHWLDDLKSIQPAFLKKTESTFVERKHIRNFDLCCGALGFAVFFSLFWIPGIVVNFYTSTLGVSEEIAEMCVVPLKMFSVFTLIVGWRSHITSWLILLKKTVVVFPSSVIRMIIFFAVLNLFPLLGIHGAPLGVAALLSGFAVETLSVQIATFVVEYKMKRSRRPVASSKQYGTATSTTEIETIS
ncbi:progressive ankylosis protein homolog [Antedon mediterranea]|uniref:progressive ankylosis protein homolog n=1 Tax=Antedon mediterranea TaxID=105859 RepID=UPI003AF43884